MYDSKVLAIDDVRHFPDADIVCRTYSSSIDVLAILGPWDLLYLDHDLGEVKTGYDVMCWLETHVAFMPKAIDVVSSNPVGRQRIETVLKKFYEQEVQSQLWIKKTE